jgi:hypothetical protein
MALRAFRSRWRRDVDRVRTLHVQAAWECCPYHANHTGLHEQNIETERLILREMDVAADAAFLHELLNEPAFIRYVGDRNVRTTEAAADYIGEKILPGATTRLT